MTEHETLTVAPGQRPGTYATDDGRVLTPPASWELLPPGDAALTRRVKQAGPHWTIQERRGRKLFSRGILAPAETIALKRAEREAEQEDPAYKRRLEAGRQRRVKQQESYVEDFHLAVVAFLNFHPRHRTLAHRLADVVTTHATPVGSGTVARTERISLERRAEAAVIAWMRHQTTAYDRMVIPRAKGSRREARRKLAEQSRKVLNRYRVDQEVDPSTCPLQAALTP